MADLELHRSDRVRLQTELARVFDSPPKVQTVLDDIGFPAQSRPVPGGRVDDYWRVVLDSLEAGMLLDGYRTLLALALRTYPFNATFRQLATDYAPELVTDDGSLGEPDPAEADCHVAIGREDEDEVVRTLAGAGLEPDLMWSTTRMACYRVGTDDARRVRAALEPTAGRWTVLAPGEPRYFLDQIVVQGPDGRSFRISDVPATTTVADIAADVLAQYPSADPSRPTVTDSVAQDGSGRRLQPALTLHEAGIRHGDSLRVGFQAMAGMINPQVRQEALYRARAQILAFADANPDIGVVVNEPSLPTVYELEFSQPSLGPPLGPGGEPVTIDHHVVQIELGPDYPLTAPAVYWLTGIFHPNVYPTYDCELSRQRPALRGLVCLGELTEAYQPGLDLGQLCQQLRDLAGFRNYSVAVLDSPDAEGRPSDRWRGNAFDADAAAWLLGHEDRIVALGGSAWRDLVVSRAAARTFNGRMDRL